MSWLLYSELMLPYPNETKEHKIKRLKKELKSNKEYIEMIKDEHIIDFTLTVAVMLTIEAIEKELGLLGE
jgi:nucleoside permease NupC